MFFLLSKLLNWFVYPLSLLFLGLIAILVFYRRRYTRWGLAFFLVLLYGMSTMLIVRPLMRWLEGPLSAPELHQHYDVAIVLTGMVALSRSSPGHLEFDEHVERILEGISLVKRGIADKLLIVGGSGSLFDRRLRSMISLPSNAVHFSFKHDIELLPLRYEIQ